MHLELRGTGQDCSFSLLCWAPAAGSEAQVAMKELRRALLGFSAPLPFLSHSAAVTKLPKGEKTWTSEAGSVLSLTLSPPPGIPSLIHSSRETVLFCKENYLNSKLDTSPLTVL